METNSLLKRLYSAARRGKITEVIKLIVTSKLSKKERCDWYCQAVIDEQKEVAEWLLHSGFLHGNEYQQTREGFAAIKAKDELLETLIKKIAKAENFPASPFMDLAVTEGNAELVSLLLSKGADVHAKVRGSFTAIHMAVMKSHSKVVEVLLAKNASVHAMYKGSTSLLHAAVLRGDEKTVDLLLKYGVHVGTERADGSTPFSIALEKRFFHITKRLIDAGVDVDAKVATTSFEMDPLAEKFVKFRKNLFELESSDSDDCPSPLQCAQQMDPPKHKDLTLLHLAAYDGDEQKVEFLVKNGADIDAKNHFYRTPLYYAVLECHEGVIKFLRENGAKIDVSDLIHIASGDCLKSAKLLLKYGADVDGSNELMQTPLHIAATFDQAEMTNLLLKYGARTDAINVGGWTPLVTAAYYGHLEVTNVLLNYGASSVLGDFRQEPAFQMALRRFNEEVMILFMNKLGSGYFDASGLSAEEKSAALLKETESFHVRSVEMFLKSGADVNTVSPLGRTALHIASEKCFHEIVELLLDYGADTELKTPGGRTALFLSVFEPPMNQFMNEFLPRKNVSKQPQPDRLKTVKALLKFGADMHAPDNDGMTPLRVAAIQHEKQARTLEIFLKFGSTNTHLLSESEMRSLFEEINRDVSPEFDPPYPRCHGREPNSKTLTASEVLVEHALLMKTANIYVGKERFFAKKFDHPDIERRFKRICEIDVGKMKNEKVGNTDVTFYDVLKSDVDQMVELAKNETIARALNGYDCEKKIALYGAILNAQFEKVKLRDFFKKGVKTCHYLINRIRPVPYDIAEIIAFRYVGRKYLRILTEFAVDLDLGFDLFKHVIQ